MKSIFMMGFVYFFVLQIEYFDSMPQKTIWKLRGNIKRFERNRYLSDLVHENNTFWAL